jgi:hypothetical protein
MPDDATQRPTSPNGAKTHNWRPLLAQSSRPPPAPGTPYSRLLKPRGADGTAISSSAFSYRASPFSRLRCTLTTRRSGLHSRGEAHEHR